MQDKKNSTSNQNKYIETDYLKKVSERALIYLNSGLPVHFSGPSGVGKTSLAVQVAKKIGRPYVVIFGNSDYTSADLLGGNYGYRRKKTVDNFIHNVYMVEEDFQLKWQDRQITKACREGHTLVYDEFSRTTPYTNNIFLSILEEGVLFLPSLESENQVVKVHPKFRLIFTSNPLEYAGVHKAQVALEDRMVTIELNEMDRETEIAITMANSELEEDMAGKVVDLVKEYRAVVSSSASNSVRTCIKLARVLSSNEMTNLSKYSQNNVFADILLSEDRLKDLNRKKLAKQIEELSERFIERIEQK